MNMNMLSLPNQYTFQTENGTTQRTSVSFGNLTACTEYNFNILAVNDVGQGPLSSTWIITRYNWRRFPGVFLFFHASIFVAGLDVVSIEMSRARSLNLEK